jgi:hypothetical protein
MLGVEREVPPVEVTPPVVTTTQVEGQVVREKVATWRRVLDGPAS